MDIEVNDAQQFADEIDRAAHISEAHNLACVEEIRRAAAPEQLQDASGKWEFEECRSCGEEIEPVRLQMGKVLCFDCQTKKEHRQRLLGR